MAELIDASPRLLLGRAGLACHSVECPIDQGNQCSRPLRQRPFISAVAAGFFARVVLELSDNIMIGATFTKGYASSY